MKQTAFELRAVGDMEAQIDVVVRAHFIKHAPTGA
jgi:hypothetical protein